MNKTTEALKLAEKALAEVTIGAFTRDCLDYHKALAAIREALAEPDMNLNCPSVQTRLATVWGYAKAEPVKQEPVAWVDLTKEELHQIEMTCETSTECYRVIAKALKDRNAAPVDAKAIRAEALEEAAKVCDDMENDHDYVFGTKYAAAIRSLCQKTDKGG